MKIFYCKRPVFFVIGILCAVLPGCSGSPPVKFYQLGTMQPKNAVEQKVPAGDRIVVGIGPVSIPDYLDRPQIVTRSGKNELRIADFDRWAGSLENDVSRVLIENIARQLPPDRFFVTKWTPLLENYQSAAYKIVISLDRFEGTRGESVSLKSQWAISARDRGLLLNRESSFAAPVNGRTYEDLVDAMSRALEGLSRDIAAGIVNIPEPDGSSPHHTK